MTAEESKVQKRLTWLLVLLVALGGLGLGASIVNTRATQAASRQDVLRNRELTQQVATLQEAQVEDQAQHRDRNEELHSCLVELALVLGDPKRDLTKPIRNPCPAPIMPGPAVPTVEPTP